MAQQRITFSGVRLMGFKRELKRGGTARFRATVNSHVCEQMGWPEPDERLTSSDPEGDLAAVAVELIPKDKELRQWAILDLSAQQIHKFQIVRRELEGKKSKGFRHELQFDVKFGDPLGCAKLEVFQLNAGEAKCGLVVSYKQREEQDELPGTRVDMSPSDDQRQAVMEMEPGEGDRPAPLPTAAERKAARDKHEAEKREAKERIN